MTKEKRENLIMFVTWVIFMIAILLSKHFLWPFLVFIVLPFGLIWILNKYKPLKKEPETAWWKELLICVFVYVVTSMIVNFVDNQPVFSSQILILTIIFILAFSLGTWLRKKEK